MTMPVVEAIFAICLSSVSYDNCSGHEAVDVYTISVAPFACVEKKKQQVPVLMQRALKTVHLNLGVYGKIICPGVEEISQ